MNNNEEFTSKTNNQPENQNSNMTAAPTVTQPVIIQKSYNESTLTDTYDVSSRDPVDFTTTEHPKKNKISAYKVFVGYLLAIILLPLFLLSLTVFNEDFAMAAWLLVPAIPAAIVLIVVVVIHWLVQRTYIKKGVSISDKEVERRTDKVEQIVKILIIVAILLFMASAIGGAIADSLKV